jgi:hypothetical protein
LVATLPALEFRDPDSQQAEERAGVDAPSEQTPVEPSAQLALPFGWVEDAGSIAKSFEVDDNSSKDLLAGVARVSTEPSRSPEVTIEGGRLRIVIMKPDGSDQISTAEIDLARRIDTVAADSGAFPYDLVKGIDALGERLRREHRDSGSA